MNPPAQDLKTLPASNGRIRLVALGDCNTNSIDPLQGTAVAGLVQAMNGRGFETTLVNLSGGMASSREGLALVRDIVPRADLAIVNYGLVDAWITAIPQLYVPYYPDNRVRKRLRKLLKAVKRRLRRPLLRRLVPTGAVVPPDEFLKNIRAIIQAVRIRNPAIAVFLWSTVPVANNTERNIWLSAYNELLKQAALSESAVYIDTTEICLTQPAADWFIDGVHLSMDTARRIGEHIADLYLKRLATSDAA